MAYWGGGGAGGWSGNAGPGPTNNKQGRVDGWDYSELGRIYNKDLIKRLFPMYHLLIM